MLKFNNTKRVLAWSLYDAGNSAFATTVMAGFFPLFFKMYWSHGSNPSLSTMQLGSANSAASLVVALLAPFLGAIADRGGFKRMFLSQFTAVAICATAGLYWVEQGGWFWAAALYVIAQVGFSGAIIFYDAQLTDVAKPSELHRVSALGYSLGYLGGGTLFAVNVVMYLKPELFGIVDGATGIRASFLSVAVWWFLFFLPGYFLIKDDKPHSRQPFFSAFRDAFWQLIETTKHVRRYRNVVLFLMAYWLYIDGVGTIIRMAVDYGMALGFEPGDLIKALLITQFVGFPSAIAFGKLGDSLGAKRAIYLALATYTGVTVYAYWLDSRADFYVLAIVIGLVQGGIQSLSRSMYAQIIPKGHQTEFFGFFNMLGKFAAIIGPMFMGYVTYITGNPRVGIFAIATFFVFGGLILSRVQEHR